MKIPYAKPESQLENKTGKWKFFYPTVNENKSIKCRLCQKACPEGIMGLEGEIPDIDYDYCKGCGLCEKICPVKAITMERVEEK